MYDDKKFFQYPVSSAREEERFKNVSRRERDEIAWEYNIIKLPGGVGAWNENTQRYLHVKSCVMNVETYAIIGVTRVYKRQGTGTDVVKIYFVIKLRRHETRRTLRVDARRRKGRRGKKNIYIERKHFDDGSCKLIRISLVRLFRQNVYVPDFSKVSRLIFITGYRW